MCGPNPHAVMLGGPQTAYRGESVTVTVSVYTLDGNIGPIGGIGSTVMVRMPILARVVRAALVEDVAVFALVTNPSKLTVAI